MTAQITEARATELSKTKTLKPEITTKTEMLRKLLSRRNGATVSQIQNRLDWQAHTVRAAISRLRSSGLLIELDRSSKSARYRLVSGEGQ